MIYSKTCEYAVRALAYLAYQGKGVYMGAAEISEAVGVPGPYIAKIFQSLVREGILKSRRGAAGGVAFCRDPKNLSLMQIIDAIEDLAPLNECAMGLDRCEDGNGCPLHEVWKRAKKEMIAKFKNTSLIELTKCSNKFEYAKLNRLRLKAAVS